MCFDHDSRPPVRPIAGGAADAQRVVLTSADGTQFTGFEAHAQARSGAAILILPDVRGLHPYYEELALRFAEHGVDALAIDYFGRTAPAPPRNADFEYRPHVDQARWETLADDIEAGVKRLRSDGATEDADPSRDSPARTERTSGGRSSLFVTGFCMGGRLAFDALTLGLGLTGAIGFYGWPVGPHRNGSPAPADVAERMEGAVLAIFGGADEGIGPEARDRFERALEEADIEHDIVTFEGAPHSFFDRKATEFAGASDAAWERTLAFIRAHTTR